MQPLRRPATGGSRPAAGCCLAGRWRPLWAASEAAVALDDQAIGDISIVHDDLNAVLDHEAACKQGG